jgi:uncharacterized protein YlaI
VFSPNTLAMPLFYLFRDSPELPQGKNTTQIRTSKAPKENPEETLICRECRQIIARPADRIRVEGSFRHTFSNPHGIVYEIGCFQSVIGCGVVGPPSNEFAWFKGYTWHILICIGCQVHMGWSFSSGTINSFYGLILDRLISSV